MRGYVRCRAPSLSADLIRVDLARPVKGGGEAVSKCARPASFREPSWLAGRAKGLPSVPGRNHWRPILSNPKGNAMSTDHKSGESSGPTSASGQGKKLLERAWDARLAEAVSRGSDPRARV
jgi:hypothetical protein